MNREAFEKIPEIAKLIEDSGAFYCNKGGWYLCPDELDFGVENYLDGAWMMYQSQQKRLQSMYDDCTEYTTVSELLNSIQRILQ